MANELVVKLLDSIIDSLDIPESYYRRAADRHRSLGEWLCRPESKVAEYSPHVTPQGSFRYGTVIRPLNAEGAYDLDNVVTLTLLKTAMTQKQLKTLFGAEIQAYADAHQMLSPLEEMNRCWRLHYADEVTFHLDTLPCVAEEESIIAAIMGLGVPRELAKRLVAITDKRHPYYALISPNWLSSNPRGFARWFEERTRIYALPRLRRLVESRLYSSVEDVPAYEWKTPLQRSIQMLKRHRDVMFEEHPELAPISMIITNLATHAYNGESDIFTAVTGIVERMPSFIRAGRPRVYSSNDDYVFASETMRGKQPYWPDNLMKRHIRPVAKANGIHKKIGWHTFRHSFGTLLKANGEDVKTVQELLRHANSRITLDVYTQAVNSNKRAAQSKVVKMMVSSEGTKAAIVGTTDSKKQAQNAG